MGQICLMPFFPSSDLNARVTVVQYFFDICNTDEQVLWLAKRFVMLFPKWPGLRELRAVACSKFIPRDKVEVYSESYADGIPSEVESTPTCGLLPSADRATIEANQIPLLEGHVSADTEADKLVLDMVPVKTIPPIPEYRRPVGAERRVENTLREILHLDPLPDDTPTPIVIYSAPAPEPQFTKTTRPPQEITAEAIEGLRQAQQKRRAEQGIANP